MKKIAERNPEELLPLQPAMFHILVALADRERHGYGIMQEVAAQTEGKMRISPGTLYGSIKRMIEQGLIQECDERPINVRFPRRRRHARTGLLPNHDQQEVAGSS